MSSGASGASTCSKFRSRNTWTGCAPGRGGGQVTIPPVQGAAAVRGLARRCSVLLRTGARPGDHLRQSDGLATDRPLRRVGRREELGAARGGCPQPSRDGAREHRRAREAGAGRPRVPGQDVQPCEGHEVDADVRELLGAEVVHECRQDENDDGERRRRRTSARSVALLIRPSSPSACRTGRSAGRAARRESRAVRPAAEAPRR